MLMNTHKCTFQLKLNKSGNQNLDASGKKGLLYFLNKKYMQVYIVYFRNIQNLKTKAKIF